MNIFQRIGRWFTGMFNKQNLKEAFGIEHIAISDEMLALQQKYRNIVRGRAPWNDEDTPSLMLAGSVSAEVARKVTVGLESDIEGSSRADYLNEQYAKVKENLRTAVIAACNGGEIIFKPYMVESGIEVTISETDCYWPIAYNTRDELTEVVFGASIQRDKYVYKLLERHVYNESAQTHEITYKAFRHERGATGGFTPDNAGQEVTLSAVPEWAHLQDITIHDIEQPLFVHFKIPTSDVVESPQLQGLPIWSKAIDMLRKADQQEARTDWEFEGGELAIDAPIDWFKKDAQGNAILPKGKERLFRTFDNTPGETGAMPFSPQLRITEHDMRMNQILRRIEFLSGVSYGIISDASVQDKTATEVRASKDRFFTTVSDIQQALEKALRHLIASFDALADLQSVPQGEYDISFTWDDSIMADREVEFKERLQLMGASVMSNVEMRAWYLGLDPDSEEAQNVPQGADGEF